MKAVTFDRFGPPDVLEISDLPEPSPGPGEVVVRVVASTVNPTDLMMRGGAQATLMTNLAPPYIAGMEFSGRVHMAGKGTDLQAGTPVIGVVNPRRPAGGAYAEFVAVSAASVAPVAESVDLIEAATLPMNALTAWMTLDMAELAPGQNLLVTGGTGIMGGLVLELARLRGITTVTPGRPEDEKLLRQLGAGLVVPRNGDLADAVLARFPDGVDALIDGALIGQQICRAVRHGGRAISLRRSHPIEDPRLEVGYVSVVAGMDNNEIMRGIAAAIDKRKITARIAEGGVFGFRDAAEAHHMAEVGGFRGRVVLTFAE